MKSECGLEVVNRVNSIWNGGNQKYQGIAGSQMHNCARIEWIAIKMLISSEDQHNQINAQKSASDVMSSDPN